MKTGLSAGAAAGTGASLVSTAGLAQSTSAATASPSEAATPKRNAPRLVYNDDGDSVVTIPHRAPMSVDALTDLIDQFTGTQVDRYVFCLGNGRVASHATQVADQYWDVSGGQYSSHAAYRIGENSRSLVENGFDPPAALGKRAREVGIEFYLSLRMNDAHFAYSTTGPERAHTAGTFWRQHPEFRLGGEAKHYSRYLFDYSHPEVRAYRLAYIEECCQKYAIDGFELDFMRHPFFFPPDRAEKSCDVMTEFVRSVRRLLDKIAKEKGVALPLQAIVPRTLTAGLQAGLDVASWVREGLVDSLVPKHFIQFNMEVPVEQFQELASGTKVQIFPCIEQRGYAGAGEDWLLLSDEKFRAAAARYWNAQVDGLYLYNFFNHRPHPLCQDDRRLLMEIGDPAMLRMRDKHYFLAQAENEARRHYLLTNTTDLAGETRQVPQPIPANAEGLAVELHLGDDLADARRLGLLKQVRLRLGIPGILPEGDRWDVKLNGVLVPHDRQTCEPDAVAFSERWIDIDLTDGPDPVRGVNEVRVILHERHPKLLSGLELTNVELLVSYL